MPICFFLPAVSGCHYRQESPVAAAEGKVTLERIAVVPFQQIVPDDSSGGVLDYHPWGSAFSTTAVPGNPEQRLETLFLKKIDESKPTFRLIAGERVIGTFRRVSANSLKASLRQILQDTGAELGADGVVVGHLHRFRQREGNAYTVEHPASVAFEIHLLRVSDGAPVWRGVFNRTQTSLMEDLFQIFSFYRGKGRWLTAEELMEEGIEQELKTFPGLP